MRFTSSLAALFAAVMVTACAAVAPIQNVSNATVDSVAGKPLTPEQVRAAIFRAGAGLGWIMKDAGAAKVTGPLILRTHSAEVDIAYSPGQYSIVYKSSINLQEGGGKIHRNYNGWIQNLNRGINAQLAAS